MKNILFIMMFLSISLFGVTSELINPKGTSIIDIGYKQPQADYSVTVPKDWVSYSALVKTIDKMIYSQERDLSPKYDCEIDYLGRENCTEQSFTCNAKLQQDRGIAEKITKYKFQNKVKKSVPREQSDNPNQIKGDMKLAPTVGSIDGSRFNLVYNVSQSSGRLPAPSTLFSQGYQKNGKFAVKMFHYGSGCGGFGFNVVPDTVTVLVNGGSSVRKIPFQHACTQLISSGNGQYAIVLAEWNSIPASLTYQCDDFCLMGKPSDEDFGFWAWACDNTFIDADGIKSSVGKCKKEYSYFNYKCKPESNTYDKPWVGPVINSGGDCNGNCGPYGCVCNSSSPPTNNCIRDTYICPFDGSQLCTITTDELGAVSNVIDNFIYSNGTADTYNKTVVVNKLCKEGKVWNKTKNLCELEVNEACSFGEGFTLDRDFGECVKPIGNITESCSSTDFEQNGFYINSSGVKQKCTPEEFTSCQAGYTYNSTKKICEAIPRCDNGTYNLITNKCELKNIACPSGYEYNTTRKRCEKPFEFTGMISEYTDKVPPLNFNCSNISDWTFIRTDSWTGKYEREDVDYAFSTFTSPENSCLKIVFEGAGYTDAYRKITLNGTEIDGFAEHHSGFWFWDFTNDKVWSKKANNEYNSKYSRGPRVIYPLVKTNDVIKTWQRPTHSSSYITASRTTYYKGQLPLYCPTGFEENGVNCKKSYCPSGYTLYPDSSKTCYKEETPNPKDIANKVYYKAGSCPTTATLDIATGSCNFVPYCKEDGVLNTVSDRCDSPSFNKCEGNMFCSYEKSPVCDAGETYNSITNKCESEPYCENGFIDIATGCKKDYTYSEYKCPTDFIGPLDAGADCFGSCGPNGCACNAPIPPANNCKKPYTLTGTEFKVYKERPLQEVIVNGAVTPKEFGVYKGFDCGENCLFTVEKIIGKDDKLCFSKENKEEECITVYGCNFKGEIRNNVYPNDIYDINIDNAYTISLMDQNHAPETTDINLSCPSGTVFNKTLRYCESVSQNFNTWSYVREGGPNTGTWTVQNSGTTVYQSVNSANPTFFLSSQLFPNNVIIEGKMKIDNDGDDDYVGLVFDYKDSRNYKLVRWAMKGDTHHDNILVYAQITNGSMRILSKNDTRGWQYGRFYNIKIIFNDKETKIYIDNQEMIVHENSPGEIDLFFKGRMGFYNYSQSKVTYKDFYIQAAPTCPATYSWDSVSRTCFKFTTQTKMEIKSTCKMNGHVGWHSRKEGITSVIRDPENKDRLLFWDSYLDKNLGFIEFIKEVKDEDKENGFLPQNNLLYEMLSQGFTATEAVEGSTIFVSSKVLTETECNALAEKNSLVKGSIVSPKVKELTKILSGDRYEIQYKEPGCLNGLFLPSINKCISYIGTGETNCANGKYDTISLPTEIDVLRKHAIWDNSQGDNITISSGFFAPKDGLYKINLGTVGNAQLFIDGSIVAYAQHNTSKEVSQNIYLNIGIHEVKVIARKDSLPAAGGSIVYGNRGFGVIIKDPSGNTISTSNHWCKNTDTTVCPTDGFSKIGNICLETSLSYCPSGRYDEGLGKCVLLPKCVLAKSGEMTYKEQTKSVKEEIRDGSKMNYKCSPLKCVNNQCQTADCPYDANGVQYNGKVFMPGVKVPTGSCTEQSCDANRDYYNYCGKDNGCDISNPLIYEENGICKEVYCATGYVMDINTKKCKKLECPEGTTAQSDGSCKRK